MYLFTNNGDSSWALTEVIDGTLDSYFGYSVALWENYLFVGAYGKSNELYAPLFQNPYSFSSDAAAGQVSVFLIDKVDDFYYILFLEYIQFDSSKYWVGSSLSVAENGLLAVGASGVG